MVIILKRADAKSLYTGAAREMLTDSVHLQTVRNIAEIMNAMHMYCAINQPTPERLMTIYQDIFITLKPAAVKSLFGEAAVEIVTILRLAKTVFKHVMDLTNAMHQWLK
jgi:hypothetical protein